METQGSGIKMQINGFGSRKGPEIASSSPFDRVAVDHGRRQRLAGFGEMKDSYSTIRCE